MPLDGTHEPGAWQPVADQVRAYEASGGREGAGLEAEWWPKATAVWPDYDGYRQATDREIPLVILDPVGT